MININHIEIEWAGSIKALTYKFDTPGLSLIIGDNGVGKTTIFNCLAWCLFGKTLKASSTIEPWPFILDKTYRGTRVTVVYTKGNNLRRITHCASYKGDILGAKGKDRLIIEVDGKPLDQLRDKKDGWKWLVSDLGYSFDLFKSSVLFGQKLKRLIDEDGPKRNEILEEAFEATFLTQAKLLVQDRLGVQTKELQELVHKLSLLEVKIQSIKDRVLSEKSREAEFDHNRIEILSRLNTKICDLGKALSIPIPPTKGLKGEISQLQKQLSQYPTDGMEELKDKEFKLTLAISDNQHKLEAKQEKYNRLKTQIFKVKKICSACNQPISEVEVSKQISQVKKDIREIKGDIELYSTKVELLTHEYNEVKLRLTSFEETAKQRSNIKLSIKKLETTLDEHQAIVKRYSIMEGQLISLKEQYKVEEAKQFITELPQLRTELKHLKSQYTPLESQRKDIINTSAMDKWLLDNPLSNTGLKAFILDKMLQQTNLELTKYEGIMGFKIEMGLDMDKARKSFYIKVQRHNTEVPHADLSGGQKQLVEVGIALAIHDTLSKTKGCNILLFDEVFESLSPNNIDKVGDLIQMKAMGKSIHIITHTPFKPTGATTTELILTNHVTQLAV